MQTDAQHTPDTDLDIRTLFAALRRQRRIIFLTVCAVISLAALFLAFANPRYTATALLIVDPDEKRILDVQNAIQKTTGAENARIDSEVEILRSDSVALQVVESLDLARDPEFSGGVSPGELLRQIIGIANASDKQISRDLNVLANLKSATEIRRRGLTYLISVSVSSGSPERAAEIANAYAETYVARQVQGKIDAALASRNVLLGQIDRARAALADAESRMDLFVNAELRKQPHATNGISMEALFNQIDDAGRVLDLLSQDRQTLTSLLERNDMAHLARTNAGNEADLVKTLVSSETLALAGRPRPFHGEDIDQTWLARWAEQALSKIDEHQAGLSKESGDARRYIQDALQAMSLSPASMSELYALQQETSVARDQYQNMLARLRDLETEAAIQVADSQIVSEALEPAKVSFPDTRLTIFAAFALALGLGAGLALVNEFYIGGISTADQLDEVLHATTAAVIPRSDESETDRISVAEKVIDTPLSHYAEAVRSLRAGIDQAFREIDKTSEASRLAKVILVTSAREDEGKSSTALALARTYALAGKRTLLIDADLRRPSLHKMLGIALQSGLSDYLNDPTTNEIAPAFYARDPMTQLGVVLGSSESFAATDQLLGSAAFGEMMAQAQKVYDIVVLDTPPVLPVVDARYIAHLADAVVMMVKWMSTTQSDLRQAAAPLRRAMQDRAAFLPALNMVEDAAAGDASSKYYSTDY